LDVYESSPDVGSSRKRIFGRDTIARAMLVRLAWPPEMPRARTDPMRTSRQPARASWSMTDPTRDARSALEVVVGSLRAALCVCVVGERRA
jgi:hypothetical protein